jgi:hypothetical protein
LVVDISDKASKLLHVGVRVEVLRADAIMECDDEHADHVLETVDGLPRLNLVLVEAQILADLPSAVFDEAVNVAEFVH